MNEASFCGLEQNLILRENIVVADASSNINIYKWMDVALSHASVA